MNKLICHDQIEDLFHDMHRRSEKENKERFGGMIQSEREAGRIEGLEMAIDKIWHMDHEPSPSMIVKALNRLKGEKKDGG